MSLTRILPVLFLAVGVSTVLVVLPAMANEQGFRTAAARDLEVRILPPEGKAEVTYVAGVGSPFELRYELRNRGNESLLVPLEHPSFDRGVVRYVDSSPLVHPGGRGWGPAPLRASLAEIAPGEVRIVTLYLTPSLRR